MSHQASKGKHKKGKHDKHNNNNTHQKDDNTTKSDPPKPSKVSTITNGNNNNNNNNQDSTNNQPNTTSSNTSQTNQKHNVEEKSESVNETKSETTDPASASTSSINSTINNNPTGTDGERKVPVDVRVAVIGNVDSGKSTMIGVLTSGDLDDGRGKARSRILKHNHERSNGRTSCSSQHILGFNNKKKPVHQPVSISATPKQKTQAWTTVFQSSKNIVTFIDLAGHEKYLKTTISGLTGCFPDYSFIVVGANMGISKMTREHIQVAIALGIPLFVVITKIDISPEKILKHTVKTLAKLLRSPNCNNKMPLIIRKKKEVKLLFEKDCYLERICPIFCVSAVKGDNIDILNSFLCRLKPREPWKHHISELRMREKNNNNQEVNVPIDNNNGESQYGELEIDETFAVRGVGIVVSGTVTAGRICPNQRMFLGPFSDSTFKEITIRSVHMKRCGVSYSRAGETCSISFRFNKRKEIVDRIMIRKGMVCISDSNKDGTKLNISNILTPVWAFTATILVLHHPTTINEGYQPVVHCGNIRQTATIMKMSKKRLRSGDSALIDMKFLCHPEFMHVNRAIIIREGNTKCIGKVIQLHHEQDYQPSLSNFKDLQKKLNLFGMGLTDMDGNDLTNNGNGNGIIMNRSNKEEKEEKVMDGIVKVGKSSKSVLGNSSTSKDSKTNGNSNDGGVMKSAASEGGKVKSNEKLQDSTNSTNTTNTSGGKKKEKKTKEKGHKVAP